MIKNNQFQDQYLVLKCRCSFVLIPSLYLEIQNIQKSGIYNHDNKMIFFKINTLFYSAGVVSY